MSEILCEKCGFFYIDGGAGKCYISKNPVESDKCGDCKTFIVRQYDGKEPFSPEEHEWLFKNNLENKKMKNIQGLKF